MEKLKMRTRSLSQEQIKAIKDVFPSCVREAYFEATGEKRLLVDFDELRQELSDQIVDGPQERFRLDWPGKREALAMANMPIEKTLLPCREESVNFEATQNLFLEGDNFEALKIIEETFLGSVRMIYIDPPYNTGRNLIYRNDYSEKSADFLERSGQISGEGGRLVANPETSGRFHSDWLSMMYQRLKVAKNILAKDGVLVCAIDENEFGTLSVLMKEVFSGAAWEHAYVSVIHNPRGQQGTNFSYINEYLIFVYPSGTKSIGDRKIREEDVNWSQFRNWGGESERTDAKNCFYPVLVQDEKIIGFGDVCPDDFHPEQTEWRDGVAYVYPIDNSGTERKWRYARQSVEEIASMLRAKRSGDGYQIEIGKTFGLYRSVWTDKRYDSNEYGTKLVNSLVEGSGFTFPKSLWAVYDPIEAVTGNHKDAIILDFFAGSATTAHAVMQLNANDGGNRRFIMVQVPEAIDSSLPPYKRGFTTIAEISKERIRRAGGKLLEGECHPDWNRDVGFRVLKVDTSNMKDVYYRPDELKQSDLLDMVDNVKDGRTAEDLLFQVLLDWGVDLTLPIRREMVQGKTVFFVDDNALVACFDRGITEDLVKELAGHEPLRVVFRDNGFVSDAVKINVEQIFRQLSPTTDVKSI
ncbi:site-specific DNA-methyltransferase [Celeribacter persicus]|uniref:site-specific DNA-methyltransferase (adenine-specific) n=1 Tax=Celeribacter persicus TaxID=1651082 RepID=A0A2T5HSS2_9RHOB|nr:site-specific DNA-methyltransferase [Celeribacter persicus]PTQ74635.1 adenine-specific DNA-methyltransferase [Celeribacter persicus]